MNPGRYVLPKGGVARVPFESPCTRDGAGIRDVACCSFWEHKKGDLGTRIGFLLILYGFGDRILKVLRKLWGSIYVFFHVCFQVTFFE